MNEYEYEPIVGLPSELPEGEQVLWQSSPTWNSMARRVFQLHAASLYFLLLISGHAVYRIMDGASLSVLTGTLAWQSGLALSVLVILAFMAKLYSNSTLYTITNRRLIIRSGVALPMIVNLPLAKVESAGLRRLRDGTGDITFLPIEGTKVYWLMLWPHVRPLSFRRVQPLLRGIEDPDVVARLLVNVIDEMGVTSNDAEATQIAAV
ncbi:photosynthetic complex putative assembly protein PuhB [Luminiphilus sp.]|nr:photosynthetic complex putative assembly protein PuhB [Luminiphilus sp.]